VVKLVRVAADDTRERMSVDLKTVDVMRAGELAAV